jgi:hypothetical protein
MMGATLPDEASATARVGRVAVALSALVAAIAIVGYQAWSTFVPVTFMVAMAFLARPRARKAEVIAMALAIGGSAALGLVGLYLVSASQFDVAAILCTLDPCPGLGPTLLVAGTAAAIGAALVAAGSVWYIRERGRVQLLLPALNVLLVGLFAIALIFEGQSGNGLVEVAGLAASASALRLAPARPRLLQAAVIAQVADMGTFGFVWQLGQGEQNPLGRWMLEALLALGPASTSWEAAVAAGLILILAKLALIGFLIGVTPHLGRYRRTVLLVAMVAGSVGATVNVLTRLP